MTDESRDFATIEEALEDIRAGKMVVVCDAEDRENEGDLVLAAQFATPEAIGFMESEARGLLCLALSRPRARGSGYGWKARSPRCGARGGTFASCSPVASGSINIAARSLRSSKSVTPAPAARPASRPD